MKLVLGDQFDFVLVASTTTASVKVKIKTCGISQNFDLIVCCFHDSLKNEAWNHLWLSHEGGYSLHREYQIRYQVLNEALMVLMVQSRQVMFSLQNGVVEFPRNETISLV